MRSYMLKAGLGEIPKQRKRTLTNLRSVILHTLIEETEQVAMGNQILNVALQSLRKTRQQIQSNNHKFLVRNREMLWVGQGNLRLV